MQSLRDFVFDTDLFIVAHRGSSGTAPENTLSSIQAAVDAGSQMVEIDVQFTKDSQVIVFHDDVLGRTTNGTGQVKSSTLLDLKKLDAGSWFAPEYEKETIPTLEEALSILKDKLYVNIEIKSPKPGEPASARMAKTVETVLELKMEDQTLFSSFHHPTLAQLKKKYPQLHIAAINVPGDGRLPSDIAKSTGCEGFVCSVHELTKKRVNDATSHGIFVGVYTINREQDFQTAMNYGVKALVTNFPARVANWLKNHSKNQQE